MSLSQCSRMLFLSILGTYITNTTSSSMTLHYITPSPTFLCTAGVSCLTLSTLATNVSHYIKSNGTLIFLAGNHTLDVNFTVTNVNEFQMLSLNDSDTARIFCSHNTLIFTRIIKMQINGLKLIGCLSRIEFIDWFRLEDSSIRGISSDSSALYISKTSADIVKTNFTFNRAGHNSRGILFLNFYNSKFMGNIHTGRATRVGGAVFIDSSNVGISYSHFSDNAAQMGGAIFSQTGSNVTISSCTFDHNSAIGCRRNQGCSSILIRYGPCTEDRCHGGALFIGSGCTLIAINSTFISNTAEITGGAIALFQGKIFDTNNEFDSNSIDKSGSGMGGGIALYSGSTLTINGSYYKGNRATRGAVILVYLHCSITIDNTVFENNLSNQRGSGGVMHAFNSSIAVDNSFFYKNRAAENGGVMYAESGVSISISNNYFASNEAGSGGVVHVHYSIITIDNNVFEHNGALDGGVVSASFSSITVRDSSFNNSFAGGNFGEGGALYASSKSNITVENSSFTNSTAHRGGGIYASQNCRITLKKSSFDNSQGTFVIVNAPLQGLYGI